MVHQHPSLPAVADPPPRNLPDPDRQSRVAGVWLLAGAAVCLLLVCGGVLVMISPFFVAGGVVGWYHGYQVQQDVLLIGWFGTSAASVALGLGMLLTGAFSGVALGVVAGASLLSKRGPALPHPSNQKL